MSNDLKKKSPFQKLLKRMLASPFQMALIIISAIVGNIFMLLGPKLIGDGIDLLTANQGVINDAFRKLSWILVLVFFLASLFTWLMGNLSARLSSSIIGKLRQEIYSHLNLLSMDFYHKTPFGQITARISTDMDQVNDGLITGLPQLFSGVVSLFGSIYFMFMISYKVALLVIGLTPIIYFISQLISKSSYHMYSKESEQRAELNGLAEEIIHQHELARSLQISDKVEQRYREMNDSLYIYGQKAQFYSSLTNPSTRLVNAITFILSGGLAAFLAIRGELSIGQVGSLLFYTNQFSKPINQITDIITQIQSALASADKIFQLLEVVPAEVEKSGTPELLVKEGNIEFEDVSFSYEVLEPLIEDLTVSIPKHSKVAIVGPTGAGKTTLVNLLMRFYELTDGRIVIDGQDIAGVTRDSLRRAFGMVLQEVWLFEGTVMENLKFANPEASDEEVIEVCKKVEADSFIRRLKHGYDTVINEESNLSLGQKQLLTVARVMLQNPPMLILDEATSAIDTVTELRVQKAFVNMMEGRTSFIIAHRLSTVLDAEIILVMNNGNIVEQGDFESLMAEDTLFKKLYNSQFQGQKT